MEKVVLAYSGGLDTSVCIPWLREEKKLAVVAFAAGLGQDVDLKSLERRALAAGAQAAFTTDLTARFAREYISRALKANAVYENGYLLATALGRPLIAEELVRTARAQGARYVAHGCTGKGNDQVRFEASIAALAPELSVIAPVREWRLTSREAEVEYAKSRSVDVPVTKASPYSLDSNLWGMAIECGALEDPWTAPPDGAWQTTVDPRNAPDAPVELVVSFDKGVPVRLNAKARTLVKLIRVLNDLGASHGVGRVDCVENRLVGIKSREVYEAPAATILIAAHRALESITLSRDLSREKERLSREYARIIYEGLWFSRLREAIDAFIDASQQRVTGDVRLRLYKGTASVTGLRSPWSLYSKELATYTAEDRFDRAAAKGFIDIWSLPVRAEARQRSTRRRRP
ncbi:MAG: argininosuccinate synthase [Planctomycetota bacterium]